MVAEILTVEQQDTGEFVKKRLERELHLPGAAGSVMAYVLETSGKMIRPRLLQLSALSLGKPVAQDAIVDVATCYELVHLASLIHDDLVDQADMRRGRPALYHVFGAPAAVLSGDYLFARSFAILTKNGHYSILELVAQTISRMCQGEVDQLLHPIDSESAYFRYIYQKTGCLLGASCRAGGLLHDDCCIQQLDRLEAFGTCLGYAFQLNDDVWDYAGRSETGGKGVGLDHKRGLWTLPTIRAVHLGVLPADWPRLQFAQVASTLTAQGILERILDEAHSYAARAEELLSPFPDTEAKTKLLNLAANVVTVSM